MPAYKDKQRGTWYANFYYKDWTGARVHKCKRGFSKKGDALQWERNFLEKESKNSDILFSNFIELYLEDMSHRLKPTTLQNKTYTINDKLIPYFGNLKINEITSNTVRQWQNELMKKGFSQTYLRTINNQMSAAMNYAMKHYNLERNPCRIAGTIGRSKADSMKIWTLDQFNHFIEHEDKPAGKLAFEILFWSGIREGELLALTQEDFMNGADLSITKNFAVVSSEELILTPKTENSMRCISIPKFLYERVMEYAGMVYDLKSTDRIFYFTKYYLNAEIKRVAAKAELEQIRVHDLRHSHASLLIEMGYDIMEISKRLGHDSVKTTWDTYGHLYPDSGKKLADGLDRIKESGLENWNPPSKAKQTFE